MFNIQHCGKPPRIDFEKVSKMFLLDPWFVWQDYPSIAHLVQKLSDHNIQTIFAVTEEFQPVYKVSPEFFPSTGTQ